jgi:hypothetical protein
MNKMHGKLRNVEHNKQLLQLVFTVLYVQLHLHILLHIGYAFYRGFFTASIDLAPVVNL